MAPSDGSGVHTLDSGYLAVTGDTIVISQHNPVLEDISAGLTARLMRSGVAPMTGALLGYVGSAGSPGITFNGFATRGFFKTTNGVGVSVGGAQVAEFLSTGLDLTGVNIATATALTTVATDDKVPISDTSASAANKYITVANLFAGFILAGSQLPYGGVINGKIAESNATNATTYALKTLAGNDPSATDPVLLCFRNATVGTGDYVYRTVTAALSLTVPSGATMGFTSGVAGKLWAVLFDDAGTIRLGLINCLNGMSIYPLGQFPIASSTIMNTSSDNAHVFYTGTAVTSKAYVPLGYASYESGIATAGSWNASPTRIQRYGAGVPLPGQAIQVARSQDSAVATGSTVTPADDTIPQNTEGDQYMSQAITPTSAANILSVRHQGNYADTGGGVHTLALHQDSVANALAATNNAVSSTFSLTMTLQYDMLAATTSATTFKIRFGGANAGTRTFNGFGGNRKMGGVMNSYLEVRELMA